MKIEFKENYDTQLTDEDGEFANFINWKEGDTEDCQAFETFINGITLEFPDGTFAENVPNRVFEVVKQ